MRKTSLFLVVALIAVIGFVFAACASFSGTFSGLNDLGKKTYALGATGPGGGIVFYDKGNEDDGWRYLEAAPADIEGKFTWIAPLWRKFSINQGENGGSEIGMGKVNTATILSLVTDAPAAKACVDYRGGGFDDWFLPSEKELVEMYKQDSLLKLTGTYYWSSTQTSSGRYPDCAQNFSPKDNQNQMYYKEAEIWVRPVRAFLSTSLTATQGAPSAQPIDQGEERIALYTWGLEPTEQPSPAGTWATGTGEWATTYTFNANLSGTYRSPADTASGWGTTNFTWGIRANRLTIMWPGRLEYFTYEIKGDELIWLSDSNGRDMSRRETLTRRR